MFEKKTCERCGKQYRGKTVSENVGRHLCSACVHKCSVCGKPIGFAHQIGAQVDFAKSIFLKELTKMPWVGSGLCMDCWRAKEDKERKEQELIKQAQLTQAKETLETPTVWICPYCNTVNRGRFCSECGASRKKEKL